MTGSFVLSIDTEDPFEPRPARNRWDAGDRRGAAARQATRRFMRLLDGHAMAATWVVGEADIFEAWGRRRSDGGTEPSRNLVGAIGAMATRQEIAVSPAPEGDPARLERCTRFDEWRTKEVSTIALPTDVAIDAERFAALGFTSCRRTPLATRPSPLGDDLFQRPLPMWRTPDFECAGPLLKVPVSLSIANIDNRRRLVAEAARLARIRKGLDRAARDDAVLHLAFQLADLGRSEALFQAIEDILFHVAEARAGGDLGVATIAGLRRDFGAAQGRAARARAA